MIFYIVQHIKYSSIFKETYGIVLSQAILCTLKRKYGKDHVTTPEGWTPSFTAQVSVLPCSWNNEYLVDTQRLIG